MEMEDSGNLISHRFSAINENLLSAIVDGYIYFSSPDGFNDPYDCRITVENSIENARAKASDAGKGILDFYTDELLDTIKSQVRKVGVACFSREIANTLMWAHYAKNHSGAVLTYEIPPAFINDNSPELLGWDKVGMGCPFNRSQIVSTAGSAEGARDWEDARVSAVAWAAW
ncbi:DUF2971 domain-containing protein, partial [Paraburkholderia aspalathi]|uniref:DUF2971 domain-containing protein n=1 Tax=Paraburkholderia aspalathi TaxID=1324617 RepID=UPI001BAD1EEB